MYFTFIFGVLLLLLVAVKAESPYSICKGLTSGSTQPVAMGKLMNDFYVVDSNINVLRIPVTNLSIVEDNITISTADLSAAEMASPKWNASAIGSDSLKNGFLIPGEDSLIPERSLCFFLKDSVNMLALPMIFGNSTEKNASSGTLYRLNTKMTSGIVLSCEVPRFTFVYSPNSGDVNLLSMAPERQSSDETQKGIIIHLAPGLIKFATPAEMKAKITGGFLVGKKFFLFEPASVLTFSEVGLYTGSILLKDFFKCGTPNILDLVIEFMNFLLLGAGLFALLFIFCVLYFCCQSERLQVKRGHGKAPRGKGKGGKGKGKMPYTDKGSTSSSTGKTTGKTMSSAFSSSLKG